MQVDRRDRRLDRPDERHQAVSAENHPPGVAVDAVVGIFETETTLETHLDTARIIDT